MYAFLAPMTLFLAVVLAVSAIGKWRSPDRGAATFTALRLPVRDGKAAAVALILTEAVVALGLLLTAGWVFVAVAVAAVALTAGMLVVVVRAHRQGATDDCGCFGEWMPAEIGGRLVVRNVLLTVCATALLLAAAGVLIAGGVTPGLVSALSSLDSAVSAVAGVLAALLIAGTTWSTVHAGRRSHPTSVPRGAGAVLLPASSQVIDLLAPSTRARLVVFVKPRCPACETAVASLRASDMALRSVVDVYAVERSLRGTVSPEPAHELPHGIYHAVDIGGSLGALLGVDAATPVAALIGTDGRQAGPLAIGSEETAELVNSIVALASSPSA